MTPTLANNCKFIRGDRSIIVLVRECGNRLLCNAERICVDWTFRNAPITHFQLRIDKRFATCVKVCDEIKRHARTASIVLFCRKTLTVRRTLRVHSSKRQNISETINGCHFHFCRALWRFVHIHGLSMKYITDNHFKASIVH